MPEVVIPLHEIWGRHEEVPDVSDCFLIGAWNDDIEEGDAGAVDNGVFPATPCVVQELDCVRAAWERDEESWGYNWAWDGVKKGSMFDETKRGPSFRFQGNSVSIRHPVYLRFQWGEGQPSVAGVQMLVHVKSRWKNSGMRNGYWESDYCDFCSMQVSAIPGDCEGRRLRALADAVRASDANATEMHLKAVALWHSQSRSERMA